MSLQLTSLINMKLSIDIKYLWDCQERLFNAVYAWLGYTGQRKSEEDIKGWFVHRDLERITFFIGYNGVDAEVTLSVETLKEAVCLYKENPYYYLEKSRTEINDL